MKILITRCRQGRVEIAGETVAEIGTGAVLFVGIEKQDNADILDHMAGKVAHLRIFSDTQGKFQYSLKEKRYPVICVPNFTLCANTAGGRRPSFEGAMKPDAAKKLFEELIRLLKRRQVDTATGVFGADMDVCLEMDGPVNIVLSS